jgi:hypothetical protein
LSSSLIETLELLQTAKKRFHDRLCQQSIDQSPDCIADLRGDNVFVLCEYLFMFASLQIGSDAESLEAYIHQHNRYLAELLSDPDARRILAVSPQRLERGHFTAEHIQKARANLLLQPVPGVDQADLQRFTVLLFSPETARQTVEALERAGYLERITTPFRSKIIHSMGVVEDHFRTYLEEITTGLDQRHT